MAPLVRRTWAPCGRTPVLMQRGRSRRKVSVIGALVISPQRRQVRAYFGLLPDANFDGESILAFVMQLRRALRVPMALIWDRLGAHISAPVAAWLVRNRRRVSAKLLPPYAPELNAVEYVWSYLKGGPLANHAPDDADQLAHTAVRHARTIAGQQRLLRGFVHATRLPLRLT